MEEEKWNVIFLPKAESGILHIYGYIVSQGYPETAEKFVDALYGFGYSIANMPLGYPVCRHSKLAKRKMHCAVFHKKYIFVYKHIGPNVVIYNILHSSRNPAYFSI